MIAEIKRLHSLKNPEIASFENTTFEPINTAAIKYPTIWLLKPLYLEFP